MGLFKLMHDFIGVNSSRFKGRLREASQKMKETKEKLRSTEKCKKLRYKTHSLT